MQVATGTVGQQMRRGGRRARVGVRIRGHTVRVSQQRSRLLWDLYGEIVGCVIVVTTTATAVAAVWIRDSLFTGTLCEVRGQDTSLIVESGALDTFQQLEQIVRCPPEPVRAGGGTLRRRRRQSILFGVGRGRRPPAHMLPSLGR